MSDPSELLKARYGDTNVPVVDRLNPVVTAILQHRTVRAFLPDALPDDTLALLIAAAQSAPTSSNLQAWSVVAVEDAAQRHALSELANNQAHIRVAPVFLVFLADLARLEAIAADKGIPSEGLQYLDTFLTAVIDAALAAQNVVLAAESQGLGTVYIGALRNNVDKVAEALNLPPGVFPVFGLSIGQPDPAKPAAVKPRLPQSAVLFRERYSLDVVREEVARYDKTISRFYAEQNLPITSWSQHSAERVRSPEKLTGRHRLREILNSLGFPLR